MHRLVALGVVVLVTLPPAQADAAHPPRAHSGNGVIRAGCQDHGYSFDFLLPAWASDWTAWVVVRGPSGRKVANDAVDESDAPAAFGQSHFQLCQAKPGRYTLSARGKWYATDYSYTESFKTMPTHFHMRLPRKR